MYARASFDGEAIEVEHGQHRWRVIGALGDGAFQVGQPAQLLSRPVERGAGLLDHAA
jgi:hypothetical protein